MSIKRINGSRGHWYKIDGEKADGVTTLIGNGMPKPALTYWAAKCVAEHVADNLDTVAGMAGMGREAIVGALKAAPWAQRDAAANRGTAVHHLAEQLVQGVEVEVPDELAGHVESYCQFLDEWRPKPVLVEATVAHRRWSYAGTLDLVADLEPAIAAIGGAGTRPLIDLKTSRSGVYPEVALQLAAYRHADIYLDDQQHEQPLADVGITGSLVVWVRADGYDVYPVDTSDRVHKDFLHVAWVARMRAKGARMDSWLGDAIDLTSTTTETAA